MYNVNLAIFFLWVHDLAVHLKNLKKVIIIKMIKKKDGLIG